jgi:hypothetical protein
MSFDISTLRRINLAPSPQAPPSCFKCGGLSRKLVTRSSNRKGNAGRPYHKCELCGKFLAFADERGNDPNNPKCYCGASSKRQIAGPEKIVSRGLHYVCRLGACDFYALCTDAEHQQITVDGDLVDLLAMLRMI